MLHQITTALIAIGPWGVFLLGFIDSAGIPIAAGMDALVIFIAVKAPERAFLTALLAVLGSTGGNIALYFASRYGGSRFARAADPSKPHRFREWFSRYGMVTVFVPALMPIPLPLKVFVVSAGVMRSSPVKFVGVILAARCLRYFGEAYLGVRLGHGAQAYLASNAWNLVGAAVAIGLLLYLAVRLSDRRRGAVGVG